MPPPWPDYEAQARDVWAHTLELTLRELLEPVVAITDAVLNYEREREHPRRGVLQRATYLSLHFGFGPGGSAPSAAGPTPAEPWVDYNAMSAQEVSDRLLSEVAAGLIPVRELLDRVISYEEQQAIPDREDLLDQLYYLYDHFALGSGGWVVPR